jgi:hypothetical protein
MLNITSPGSFKKFEESLDIQVHLFRARDCSFIETATKLPYGAWVGTLLSRAGEKAPV